MTAAEKRERARHDNQKRAYALVRLRVALQVLREYGCLWEYERACADEGIENPLLLPEKSAA